MKNFYCITALLFLSLIMTIPLFQGKIVKVHDSQYAFIKTVSMYQSWADGDFAARWTPDIIKGYGYPAFNYYAPLFFVITATLSIIFHNLFWGFNLGLILVLFGSACAMYFYAKEFWGIEGGFLSAVAYLFAPYHIVELYVRGSCGELTAFVFIPLTLYAFHRLSIVPKTTYFLLGVISLASLTLSHNLTAMFCFPILFAYAAIIVWQKELNIRWALLYLIIFGIALSLSAYFWAPALLEKHYVQIGRILQNYDYSQHFLYWDQLIYCHWGNGGSGPGRADGMPFQVGPLHLIFILIILVRFKHLKLKDPNSRTVVIFWFIIAASAALLTLQISAPIWKVIPIMQLASLPWRFLLVVALAVSFLVGGLCAVFKQHSKAICLSAATFIIATNIFYCHDFGYQDISFNSPKEYLRSSTPLDAMEYLPQNVKILRLNPSADKLEVIEGVGTILNYHSSSGLHHTYTFLASTPVVAFFHSFYFPGWQVKVDKNAVPILSDNPFGLIAFMIPAGQHQIEVDFQNTPIRTLCERLSLITLLILILLFFFRRKVDTFLQTHNFLRT